MTHRRPSNTPHDAFVRNVFNRPDAVAIELRHVLPVNLSRHLDFSTLEPRPSAFVGRDLETRQADLLWGVHLRGVSRPVAIGTLIEHLSNRDRLMPWRTTDYLVRTWNLYIDSQARPPKLLPFMLPILLAQRRAWTTPTRLSQIIDLPPEVMDDFGSPFEVQLLVDDLSGSVLDDPGPHEDGGLTLALVEVARALLHAHRNQKALTPQRLAALVPLFVALDLSRPGDARMIWTYILDVFGTESLVATTFRNAVEKSSAMRGESSEMFLTKKNPWFAEGRVEGRVEGQREWLIELLEQRSLSPTAPVRDHILASKDEQQLRRWFQRALAAASIDEVFPFTEPLVPHT